MTTPTHYLDLAARAALRAQGYVEPNPLVGAVIVKDGRIIGRGHHKKFGGLHAETEALADCRARSKDPRGSTIYVTLEPCNHYGKQPPCSKAIIEAGIARVVIARRDPNSISTGGAAALEKAGVQVEFTDASPLATHISDPFIKRIITGLPWVIAKWAQTGDGRIEIRPGDPKWISNEFSRRRVHRLRARVDVILTGIGTVLADDPLLTARGVKLRRVAKRVILDSSLRLPVKSAIVQSAASTPTLVFGDADRMNTDMRTQAQQVPLATAKVSVQAVSHDKSGLDVHAILRHLAAEGATNILLEGGPRLIRAFLGRHLADELLIHIAPPLPNSLPSFAGYTLIRSRPVGGDLELRFRLSQK